MIAGVFSSVCIKFGFTASRKMTAIAPAQPICSAVTATLSSVYPTTMRPNRARKSSASFDNARIAITSEAAVISKPDCRTTPSSAPPMPITMLRKARSLTSSTRRQVIFFSERPNAFP